MICSVVVSNCGSAPIPKVNVRIWAGDAENVSITRSQDPDQIKCESPRFNEFACMSYQDLAALFDALQNSCQQFDQTKLMTAKEKKIFYNENRKVIDRIQEYR